MIVLENWGQTTMPEGQTNSFKSYLDDAQANPFVYKNPLLNPLFLEFVSPSATRTHYHPHIQFNFCFT